MDGYLDVEKALVECSMKVDNAIAMYENRGYKIVTNRKDYHVGVGKTLMCNENNEQFVLRTNFERFKDTIEWIDINLNVLNGNLEAVVNNRYRHIRGKSRDNRLTKTFNKLLRDTIVEDYPEVVI